VRAEAEAAVAAELMVAAVRDVTAEVAAEAAAAAAEAVAAEAAAMEAAAVAAAARRALTDRWAWLVRRSAAGQLWRRRRELASRFHGLRAAGAAVRAWRGQHGRACAAAAGERCRVGWAL
jgi:hypothetical protein